VHYWARRGIDAVASAGEKGVPAGALMERRERDFEEREAQE
jgi:hypothetical protein